MKHTLVVRMDEAVGELGLVLRDLPYTDMPMVAMTGLQIAHDIVEHMNGTRFIGGIGDELEALGAVWFVRGITGELRRDGGGLMHSVEVHLASDVSRMAVDYVNGVGLERYVPRTRACSEDCVFKDILSIAEQSTRVELEHMEDTVKFPRDYFRAALHYMRAGYRKACRKYKRTEHANQLFWNISNAVDGYIKSYGIQAEGQQCVLKVQGLRVSCEEVSCEY